MIEISYIIIYGFVLTALIGFLASWIDRKVTARVQYRVGPPLIQPAVDIIKLLGKETLIPNAASRVMFLGAPFIGLIGVIAASTLLWVNNGNTQSGFFGDLIVAVYLLILPSLGLIIGGFASGNPLASLGASREMKLVLAYELPFWLSILVPVIQAGNTIQLGEIIQHQVHNGVIIGSVSGFIACAVALLCIQAKLGLVPFDIPEAETELAGGLLIEYSGTPLAIFKLVKTMLLCTLPFFLMILFMGGIQFSGLHSINGILKFIGIVALITVIRNTNPRVRIDQAVRFFWGPMTVLAVIGVILALLGL
ncbi:MAG: hypothetical protein GF384_02105 [Elusimicrobia bacterium]|nr:hypothetical protein [Elusimicrobiota bacterium]MBD3411774.1 hypothetical protein [Elusimicrobiota bacterium]